MLLPSSPHLTIYVMLRCVDVMDQALVSSRSLTTSASRRFETHWLVSELNSFSVTLSQLPTRIFSCDKALVSTSREYTMSGDVTWSSGKGSTNSTPGTEPRLGHSVPVSDSNVILSVTKIFSRFPGTIMNSCGVVRGSCRASTEKPSSYPRKTC